MASEVWAALIGGGAGLCTGVAGSLIAPWVNWRIEQHRLRRETQTELVRTWRAGIARLREIEDEVSPLIPFDGGYLEVAVGSGNTPDPVEADVSRMDWFVSIRPHLSAARRSQIQKNCGLRVSDRKRGELPDLLSSEVDELQRRWKLI